MDITTIGGIIVGFGLVFWAIFMGGGVGTFINIPAMAITGGGTLAAVLINYPLPDVLRVVKVAAKAFTHKPIIPLNTINLMVELAGKARREGFMALEDDAKKVDDPFLRKGLEFVIDGTPQELSRNILESEIASLEARHAKGEGIFRTAGRFAPAFGMVGTLIGLIQMLRTLDDPTTIGPGMSVALVTTFYGLLLANLIFLPIAGKLRELTEEEILERRLVIEGIAAIQAGETPIIVEEKLRSFLPPEMRAKIVRRKKAAPGAPPEAEAPEAGAPGAPA